MPTTFRWFGLRRKDECTSCKACAKGCGSLAIDTKGNIDQRECMLCLDCMVLYYDDHACPPLAQERKRRDKAGQPLTPIDGKGYFIPDPPGGRPIQRREPQHDHRRQKRTAPARLRQREGPQPG
jgi:NosR/NirI family nitrous oxide reductase transcriptional regulator